MAAEEAWVDAALRVWKTTADRTGGLFTGLSEQQLLTEVAPGKNRLVYLWGHLAAVHDAMLPLLGLGERLHPELDAIYVKNPDRAVATLTGAELRRIWGEINDALSAKFAALPAGEWLKRHTSVSEEDFAKEPHRNRFTILIGRTTHMAYHLGQAKLAEVR